MRDIKLSDDELALWNEVGPRGDAFRAATRDRAAVAVDNTGKMVEILEPDGQMVGFEEKTPDAF